MVFSETTNRTGIVELLEDLTSTQSSSTSSYTLATKTRDINNAYDEYTIRAIQSSGTWQFDDTNQTDYPVATTDIVSSQEDYTFTTDENGNQILDISRVECKDANGNWTLLEPYNELDEDTSLSAQATTTGTPTRYYKTANGIKLDRTPNYNSTDGLKIYFDRTSSYFTTSDTTKKPGIPNIFHKYLAYLPAYLYWLPKDTQKAQLFQSEVLKIEKMIGEFYSKRTRDEKPRLTVKQNSTR